MGVLRSEPYIWATWLTSLLVGEESCEWGAWFKAHHQKYDRVPDTFEQTKWQIDHAALLREIREKLDPQYAIFLEAQNRFRLQGKESGIVVGGKPDLIAIKGDHGLVCDAKTGQPRPSDHVQVMIYMWAIPLAFRQYRTMKFDGKV
ncbi:MAG: PD-(D/E)XK nuclease family protein, partial [Dehalococcoidia bacterium]